MNLEALKLEEISFQESQEIEGGVAVPVAVAVVAAGATVVGVIVVGAVVGYGIYKFVDWATS
ncbi:class IIb bacteriocin, lactobin A/cerein 7B family [Flavobacterium hiemivividum]|uniref:Class IIb bacteriocin, lactobin A/cerein 7B family n=1 Tax=Flavobacterium hiemivividum TaxID=2541734 RepID=A0A4R5CU14_9FLAO|nr:class IIb bacteriocin, lactobin A/cerein 7B family [Flavobacterium hiemivividum]TDE01964.1 class IIb bacteriocin, lactobin A/cerein 7B family [Flavobacterium hiemivividum]